MNVTEVSGDSPWCLGTESGSEGGGEEAISVGESDKGQDVDKGNRKGKARAKEEMMGGIVDEDQKDEGHDIVVKITDRIRNDKMIMIDVGRIKGINDILNGQFTCGM